MDQVLGHSHSPGSATPAHTGVRGATGALERLAPNLATAVLPFALVLYLALQGGGYDSVVRSEVGILVWWIVLLGSIAGLLPLTRIGRAGWIGIAILAAFAAWTALGIGWSESSERSVEELARVLTLLAVLVLAISVQGRDGVRRTVNSVALAIAAVAVLSLLSRLHPDWFPANEPARFLQGTGNRLNYPLDYWNGVAALMALGVPLLAVIATHARGLLTQALAAASLPVLALVAFYTFSRGGAVEIAFCLITLMLLHPARLALLPTLILGIGGSALVIAAAAQRDALENGALGSVAAGQGDEMIAVVLVVCGGVALLRVALGLAARHGIGPRVNVSRRATTIAFVCGVLAVAGIALAAGLPSELSERWSEFKDPTVDTGGGVERFDSGSGSGRYQQWQAAVNAGSGELITGIGPGTYEYWWAREAPITAFARDAHSLYLEVYAELGIVGVALIVSLIGLVVGIGLGRVRRAAVHERAYLAAAVASVVAFATAAAIDWAWELTVLPVTFLLLAGALLAAADRPAAGGSGERAGPSPIAARLVLAGVAIVSMLAIAIPLATTSLVRESQENVRAGDLAGALDAADSAAGIEPYAASPELQRALVLELQGDYEAAVSSARAATDAESTNWRTWLLLSRMEAQAGNAPEAIRAYDRARELNPRFVTEAPTEAAG